MYHSLTTIRFARLHPDVDAAGRERLLLPDLQIRSVHPVGDAVVLPDEVVVPLAHEAAVDLEVVGLERGARARLDAEGLALLGAEIGLEHQLVGRVVAVGVDQLRQHRLALVVEHHRLAGVQPGRQLAQVREGDGDGLGRAGHRQRVLHLHGDAEWRRAPGPARAARRRRGGGGRRRRGRGGGGGCGGRGGGEQGEQGQGLGHGRLLAWERRGRGRGWVGRRVQPDPFRVRRLDSIPGPRESCRR